MQIYVKELPGIVIHLPVRVEKFEDLEECNG